MTTLPTPLLWPLLPSLTCYFSLSQNPTHCQEAAADVYVVVAAVALRSGGSGGDNFDCSSSLR